MEMDLGSLARIVGAAPVNEMSLDALAGGSASGGAATPFDIQSLKAAPAYNVADFYGRNRPFVKPGISESDFATVLNPSDEVTFRAWVQQNRVPFDLNAQGPQDYDMRGFWKGLTSGDEHATSGMNPSDKRLHFSDYWKTPYHESFSSESKFAGPNAPRWTGDDRHGWKLVGADGTVYKDESIP